MTLYLKMRVDTRPRGWVQGRSPGRESGDDVFQILKNSSRIRAKNWFANFRFLSFFYLRNLKCQKF